MRTKLTCLSLAIGLACCPSVVLASETSSVVKAFSESTVKTSFRYRLETVDQDGLDEDATANTVLGRVTAKTGKLSNWQGLIEFDYVAELFDDDYNDTVNGNTTYPVVADPSGPDLNQFSLQYKAGGNTFTFGRQRINHNTQRFVGGVAWRQNEQTFDGVRYQRKFNDQFSVDYNYSWKVNRIFGRDNANGRLDVDLHMLNAVYKPAKGHKFEAFYYNMDFDTALALSNSTAGFDYVFKGKSGDVGYGFHASYATQKDTGDAPIDYSADYFALDGSVSLSGVSFSAGVESLGGDNGKGFQMPLSTLHKFQGFADKFLGTPGVGVEDRWIKVATKISGVNVFARYHQFDAEQGGADFGSEFNLQATYALSKNYKFLVKYASYDAETLATDTDKFWFQMLAAF